MEEGSLDFYLQNIPDCVVLAFVVDIGAYYIDHVDMTDFDYRPVDIDFVYLLLDIGVEGRKYHKKIRRTQNYFFL